MTYNVHSSIGMDGKISPLRIAEVIARYNPSVVALQELDAGLVRTAMIDQAHLIAASLEMSYHFHSSIRVEAGEYGNAILSRFPIHLVKGGPLPTSVSDKNLQPRGAVWAEIEVARRKVQILATHFGLNRHERMAQAEAITGPQWLGHRDCTPPVIVCGDFNTMPWSPVYRHITTHLQDAQRVVKGKTVRKTWPALFPVMRIDHLFVSSNVRVRSVLVPWTPLTRVASDHLPLIATVELT